MNGKLGLLLAAFSLAGCTVSLGEDHCTFSEPRQASAEMAGAERIRVVARAGSLAVRGREGATGVEVDGTACASRESMLEDVRIETRRRGAELIVEAIVPESHGWSSAAKLDLDVEVPAGVPIEIEDESGEIVVADVGSLRIDDGSGSLEASRIAGSLTIDDGSGWISVEGVRGSVKIDDGSGGVELRDVGGDVEIDDGSGEIEVRNVDGSVRIRDGSGSIDVADVGGDFDVDSDGSGSILHDRVAGRVSIPRRR